LDLDNNGENITIEKGKVKKKKKDKNPTMITTKILAKTKTRNVQ
jgi:hypothetical protein